MARQKPRSETQGSGGQKKLAVKKVLLKNLDTSKEKNPKGGRALTRRNDG